VASRNYSLSSCSSSPAGDGSGTWRGEIGSWSSRYVSSLGCCCSQLGTPGAPWDSKDSWRRNGLRVCVREIGDPGIFEFPFWVSRDSEITTGENTRGLRRKVRSGRKVGDASVRKKPDEAVDCGCRKDGRRMERKSSQASEGFGLALDKETRQYWELVELKETSLQTGCRSRR
jgi:hypothetical protein